MPMVGLYRLVNCYMVVAIEDIVDESIDNGGFADGLVPEEHNFILQKGRDGPALAEVEITKVGHTSLLNLKLLF